MSTAILLLGAFTSLCDLPAQIDNPGIAPAPQVIALVPTLSGERIFGVIPGYHFVETPEMKTVPLASKEKFVLFVRETFDPFTIFGSVMGATYSHITQEDPIYGQGSRAYRQRVGAAYADVTSQNFFSDYLLASVFKEDPRYFRLGPKAGIPKRVLYSMSRVAVCRTDAGKDRICLSSLLGTGMGIALSNAYYPSSDQSAREMGSRVATSFSASALTNLLPEFWPDIKQKLLTPHPKKPKN